MQTRWPVEIHPIGPAAAATLAWRHRGRLRITVVAKATFSFVADGIMPAVAPDEIHATEIHYAGSPAQSVWAASDLAPFRARADVVLTGHAQVPEESATVRLAIYRDRALIDKSFDVIPSGALEGQDRVPLRYEHAPGGPEWEDNPVGTSHPSIVDTSDPQRPVGFGPIAAAWPARARLLGALDPRALAAPVAHLPDDLDWSYFGSAPADQVMEYLQGDEWIVLESLVSAHPLVQMRLPSAHAEARVFGLGPEPGPVAMVADHLHIDVDRARCSVTWRGSFEVGAEDALQRVSVLAGVAVAGQPILWPAVPPPRHAPVAVPQPPPGPPRAPVAAPQPPPASRHASVAVPQPPPASRHAPVAVPQPPPASVRAPVAVPQPPPASVRAPVAVPQPPPASLRVPVAVPQPPPASVRAPVAVPQPPPASVRAPIAVPPPPPASFRAPIAAPPLPPPPRASMPATMPTVDLEPSSSRFESTMVIEDEPTSQPVLPFASPASTRPRVPSPPAPDSAAPQPVLPFASPASTRLRVPSPPAPEAAAPENPFESTMAFSPTEASRAVASTRALPFASPARDAGVPAPIPTVSYAREEGSGDDDEPEEVTVPRSPAFRRGQPGALARPSQGIPGAPWSGVPAEPVPRPSAELDEKTRSLSRDHLLAWVNAAPAPIEAPPPSAPAVEPTPAPAPAAAPPPIPAAAAPPIAAAAPPPVPAAAEPPPAATPAAAASEAKPGWSWASVADEHKVDMTPPPRPRAPSKPVVQNALYGRFTGKKK